MLHDPHIANLEWRDNAPLGPLTSMGVECLADAMAVAHSAEALGEFLRLAARSNWRWHLLGGGTNTIFLGGRFNGVVLRLGREFALVEREDEAVIKAGAAAPLSALVRRAAKAGLCGLEFGVGIPGQVGGALWGNAGQRGEAICPLVEAVWGFTPEGEAVALRRGEFDFGYRYSMLSRFVLVDARFVLKGCGGSVIREKLQGFLSIRKEQPVGLRSSGCIFKNPEGDSAGRLIDAAGLKGFSIGGAEVSRVHANFILNRDGATPRDIEALIGHVRATVHARFGVDLQLEVRLVD